LQRDYQNCKGLYFTLLRLFGPLIKSVFGVKYSGVQNIPNNGSLIVCCNHKSVYDPILLAIPFRQQVRYMAKSELFTDHGRLARIFLKALGAFPVHRNTGDLKSIRKALAILKGRGTVGIFPQGGIVPGNAPFQSKSGVALLAAKSGAPVLPAAICCDGPVAPFHCVEIRFGKLIPNTLFPGKGAASSAIRRAAEKLADQVNWLLEGKT
jgi:1-acyl-sn-glycerol-3-phosphate acyltransferase